MWRTPRWLSASITAFWTAGIAPTVPDSPIPLAPSGLSGRGGLGADRLELDRRPGLGGRFGIDHGRERLIVDDDQLGGVDGRRPALGRHHGHHVTDEADPLPGQRRTGEGRIHHHQPGGDGNVEVGGDEHTGHPGHRRPLGAIHGADLGVGHRGPDEDEVEDAGNVEVVDIGGPAEEHLGVLDAADGITQEGSGGSHARGAYGSASRPRIGRRRRSGEPGTVTYKGL